MNRGHTVWNKSHFLFDRIETSWTRSWQTCCLWYRAEVCVVRDLCVCVLGGLQKPSQTGFPSISQALGVGWRDWRWSSGECRDKREKRGGWKGCTPPDTERKSAQIFSCYKGVCVCVGGDQCGTAGKTLVQHDIFIISCLSPSCSPQLPWFHIEIWSTPGWNAAVNFQKF